jgi:hypothetical protein
VKGLKILLGDRKAASLAPNEKTAFYQSFASGGSVFSEVSEKMFMQPIEF